VRHSQTKSEDQREEKMHYGSCLVRKTKLVVCDTADRFFSAVADLALGIVGQRGSSCQRVLAGIRKRTGYL